MPFPHDHTRILRMALLTNAIVCALAGVLLVTTGARIAGMFGWAATPFGMPGPLLFQQIGVFQFILAALALVGAFATPLVRPLGVLFVIANLLWFVLSWVLMFLDLLMTTMGITLLAIQSAIVLAVALFEYAGVRQLRRPAAAG